MKHKVVFKVLFEFDKEDRFLNEMSAKGFDLVRWFPFFYIFESGEPGVWTYRSGVLPRRDREQYLGLLADAGIETVATGINGTATFRKRTAEGPFELYSDTESRVAFLRGWRNWLALAGSVLALIFVPYNYMASRDLSRLEMLPLLLMQLAAVVFFGVLITRFNRQIRALEAERLITE